MGESGIGCGDVIYSNLTFMIHVSGFEIVPKLKTDGLLNWSMDRISKCVIPYSGKIWRGI